MISTQNPSRIWSSFIIEKLVQNEVYTIYASPGMRNAPLISAAHMHPQIILKMGIDERSQGFRALGHGLYSRSPAALLCTSGSAQAHYFPAVIEAFRSRVPLIIISADRPRELTLFDANQCFDQEKFFGNHVKAFIDLGPPTSQISPNVLGRALDYLFDRARGNFHEEGGPVHFNCPLRDPLDHRIVSSKKNLSILYQKQCVENLKFNKFKKISNKEIFSISSLPNEITSAIKENQKILLIFGNLSSIDDLASLKILIEETNILKMTDITSNLKYLYTIEDHILPSFDHPVIFKLLENDPPDLIIHLGGRVTSQRYYDFLRSITNFKLITINGGSSLQDPSSSSFQHLNLQPHRIALTLKEHLAKHRNWISPIPLYELARKQRRLIFKTSLSYAMVIDLLIKNSDREQIFHIGNSTLIRTFDQYISTTETAKIRTITHRGISGIEGFNASYLGILEASETSSSSPYLIVGDVSFIHDMGSLSLYSECSITATILLVNNGCGGIFNLLPIKNDHTSIRELTTPQNLSMKTLAALFDFKYIKIETIEDLRFHLPHERGVKRILDIIINDECHSQLHEKLQRITV